MLGRPAITKLRLVLLLLACASSSLQFHGDWMYERDTLVLRVLTLLLLVAMLVGVKARTAEYRSLILAGLVFAIAGEILFARPNNGQWFVWCLACYMVTNLLYMVAFSLGVRWRIRDVPAAIPFVASAAVMFLALRPEMGVSRGPVAAYAVVITTMAWRAAVRAFRRGDTSSLLACVGTILFIISDSFLAWYLFRQSLAWSLKGVILSYDIGQMLIVLSVLFDVQPAPQPGPAEDPITAEATTSRPG